MNSKKSILRTSRGIPRPVSARSNRSERFLDNKPIKPKKQEAKPLQVESAEPFFVSMNSDSDELPKKHQGFDQM